MEPLAYAPAKSPRDEVGGPGAARGALLKKYQHTIRRRHIINRTHLKHQAMGSALRPCEGEAGRDAVEQLCEDVRRGECESSRRYVPGRMVEPASRTEGTRWAWREAICRSVRTDSQCALCIDVQHQVPTKMRVRTTGAWYANAAG